MNIFHVNSDPRLAARDLCDKHVVKMILESAQMLCSGFPKDLGAPYKRTHYNHPSTIWTRTTKTNYLWLTEHALELNQEYGRRYNGKSHKSVQVIEWCRNNIDKVEFINQQDLGLTEFAQCMPEIYKVKRNPVQAYRNYYVGDKQEIVSWKHPGVKPEWFIHTVVR